MVKKVVEVQIDDNNFPMLFNIKNENLGDICYEIFCRGYQSYFPEQNKGGNSDCSNGGDRVLKSLDYHTDSIKLDLKQLNNHLDGINFDEKLEQFSYILEELLGITNNSSKKGKMAEDMIYTILKNKYKDYTIEETRHLPHHGDGIINIPSDILGGKVGGGSKDKIMLEIKNYSRPVNSDEIEKLRYDMKYTNIKYSLFLSLRSGFVGKKQMAIEEFDHNGSVYYIIFIPNVMGEISKVEAGITLAQRLVEFNKNKNVNHNINIKWLETNISNHLLVLDKLYTDYTQLKNKYHKMEKNIKDSLSEYYLDMRSYEVELKVKINKIWKSINNELGNAKRELMITEKIDKLLSTLREKKTPINKTLVKIFELMIKYGYMVQNTKIKKGSNLWHIVRIDDEEDIVGQIIKNKEVQVILNNPYITLNIKNSYNEKDLIALENILEMCSK